MSINMSPSAILLVLGLGMCISYAETVVQPGALSSFPDPTLEFHTDGLAVASKLGVGGSQPPQHNNCAWHHYGLRIRFPLPTRSYSHPYIVLPWTSGKATMLALSALFKSAFESKDVS